PPIIIIVSRSNTKGLLDSAQTSFAGYIFESLALVILIVLHQTKIASCHDIEESVLVEILYGDAPASCVIVHAELPGIVVKHKVCNPALTLPLLVSVEGIYEIALYQILGWHLLRETVNRHVAEIQ